MTITSAAGAGAYAAMQKLASPASAISSLPKAGGDDKGGFAAMLSSALGKTAATGKAADMQALAGAAGQADLINVVTAVAESEAALETLVAVRDRVIAAYEEIMRMPI